MIEKLDNKIKDPKTGKTDYNKFAEWLAKAVSTDLEVMLNSPLLRTFIFRKNKGKSMKS